MTTKAHWHGALVFAEKISDNANAMLFGVNFGVNNESQGPGSNPTEQQAGSIGAVALSDLVAKQELWLT